ncbi:MAG: phosphatidate cytidylyltransferase [Candidatus Sigynarchaeota archaeon]
MFVLPYLFNALLFAEMSFFGILLVYVGWRNKGKHLYCCCSSLVAAVQVFVIAFAITFASPFPRYPGMFPYPYPGFMQWWTWAWAAITTAFFLKEKLREPRMPAPVAAPACAPAENKACTNDSLAPHEDGLKYKHEKARKAFHLAGLLVVVSYFLVSPLLSVLVNEAIVKAGPAYEDVWGPISEAYFFSETNLEEAAVTLTLFALTATVILVMLIDMFRLLAGNKYSIIMLVERRLGRVLRDKERNGPGAQDYFAISSTCAWLVGIAFGAILPAVEAIRIAIAAIVISTLADGAAAIVGKACGRHEVRRPYDQVKSIEGFIAGFVVAFICGIIFTSWLVAIVIAVVFLLIDYLSPPVADNAINPVVLTVIGCLVTMLL